MTSAPQTRADAVRARTRSDADRKAAVPAPPSAEVSAVGPVPGRIGPIQRKVSVGAVGDPLEIEADEVARSVVARLRRSTGAAAMPDRPHGPDCGCADGSIHRHSDHDQAAHPATGPGAGGQSPIGFAGGDLDAASEARLRATAGQGAPIPAALRSSLEGALDADLSGIRLHGDAAAGQLNRGMSALAFTHGRDVYFRDGLPDTSSDAGLHLLAHELTHTVQQGAAPVRRKAAARGHQHDHAHDEVAPGGFAGAVGVRRATSEPRIMRHAAYEHYLLGQLQPKEIASIPEVRKIKKNKGQAKNVKKGHDAGLEEGDASKEKLKEVKHLIDQEMTRLLKFKDDPEALGKEVDKKGQVSRAKDKTWNVPIVVLPCKDDEIVVTYSEMNTMPDLFGNPEAIAATPKANVLSLLQGVRQQLYIELSNIREELFGESNNQLYSKVLDGDFEGAQGPRAQAVNAKAYEIRTEKQVNAATTREGEEHEQYFAALERNACHFAPESWNQWRAYHEKAVSLAQQGAIKKALASLSDDPEEVAELEEEAADLGNQALIQNSFGEHYLQDSFASGHLIDKTKIMRWFTLWLDKTGQGLGSGPQAKGQWAMAVHAAKQDLTSNPQMLHDKAVRGEVNGAQEAQQEIGMKSSPEIEFMMKWRALVKQDPELGAITVNDAAKKIGVSRKDAATNLKKLVAAKFAYTDWEFPGEYFLTISQSQAVDPFMSQAYNATKGTQAGKISDGEAQDASAEFNLAAYNSMLSNAYIGASTKFFHDKFCKEGLQVMSGSGVDLGRIYGDANMMNAGGQKGLEYAAETSRRSRSAVFNILAGEKFDEKYTTDNIAKRFPAKVKVFGAFLPIEDFNNTLRDLGENKGLFKQAKDNGALLVYKVMNGISDKGAMDLNLLVKGVQQEVGVLDSASEEDF
jgi:hypothetical protein